MNKIKNLRIIKHFKSEDYNSIHGIYECDYNGQTTVFIRHGKEIGVVTTFKVFTSPQPTNENIIIQLNKLINTFLFIDFLPLKPSFYRYFILIFSFFS